MLPIQTILHATDFSPESGYAFQLACALARDSGARLLAVHTYQPHPVSGIDPVPSEMVDGLRKQLAQVCPSEATIPVEYHLRRGVPAEEIMRLARESHCDLIVMGTHRRSNWGRLLLGSVAEAVVRQALCPVLTIKAPVVEIATTPAPHSPEVARV